MSAPASESGSSSRGRGKSRGGLGKYLRARGRRGGGRPAEFRERLVLEGERPEEEDEEETEEREKKYSRRQLGTNADRYKEEEPELGSDGEPIVEPEVDLSEFMARQRLQDDDVSGPAQPEPEYDESEVDHSLAHLGTGRKTGTNDKKGKIQQLEWDSELENMRREKDTADAQRDLIGRFRTSATRGAISRNAPPARAEKKVVEAPLLPTEEPIKPKSEKENMEDFLDDLLG